VVLAAPVALEPLVRLTGAVDRLLPQAGLDPLAWTGPPPAVAVNLHGAGPQSHRLLGATRPGRLVAFGCPEADHGGPRWDPEEHEVRRWCRLVADGLGLPADPGDLLLDLPDVPAPVPDAVVVHPGAAFGSRRWPAARFAEVARSLVEQGHEVVLTGGPGEVDLAEEVRRGAGLPPGAVLAGRTDLALLAAQVAAARLVVCGDTGVAHLASAFGTRSVLLFGPTPPSRWGPPAAGPHTVLWHGVQAHGDGQADGHTEGDGDPWGAEVDPALLRIGVGEVLQAVEAALRAPGRRPRPPSRVPAPGRTTPASA
jgi:hypothetical protein